MDVGLVEPVRSPDQPLKYQPVAGTAVNCTTVPCRVCAAGWIERDTATANDIDRQGYWWYLGEGGRDGLVRHSS